MKVISTHKTDLIRVSITLKDVLAAIQKEFALCLKDILKADKIEIVGTVASEILARRYLEQKNMKFKINKIGKSHIQVTVC